MERRSRAAPSDARRRAVRLGKDIRREVSKARRFGVKLLDQQDLMAMAGKA
jgi:hypothetical protein